MYYAEWRLYLTNDRLERERTFHNNRFSKGNREAQGKYYAAIKDGACLFEQRLTQLARGSDILEYGCGTDCMIHRVAGTYQNAVGIDISEVAIACCKEKASGSALRHTRFEVMNAERMDFDDSSFDVVFGRGILHHLDIDKSFHEIARVLRPNGKAVFWEPLGHNWAIEWYRKCTPHARTADEHPLHKRDIEVAKRHFGTIDLQFFGLTTLLSCPFRDSSIGDCILKATSALDRILFALPTMKWQAWYCLIECSQPLTQ